MRIIYPHCNLPLTPLFSVKTVSAFVWLTSLSIDVQFPHLASINPREIGEVLLLTEGRGWEFSLPNKLSLIFHWLGRCRNALLLLIVWPILMPQSAVWNPWISTVSPLKIHQWEYGVLLLGRGRNIGILLPPWSLLILVEDREESCYPMMDWYCFLFRMLPLLA